MQMISASVRDTLNIGRKIAKNLKVGDIICLFGELGSGKTVLTKGIAQGLGVPVNRVVSPSFVLIREYPRARLPLYHFDLYRLKGERDIITLGYQEYLYGEGVTVIEWADRLRKLLPKEYLKINLQILGEKKRKIIVVPFGRRYDKLAELLYEPRPSYRVGV